MEQNVKTETTTLTVMPHGQRALASWQPDELRQRISQEKALRRIVVEYYQSEMKPEQHFYVLQGTTKPAVTKEGSLNLCSLFNVTPQPDPPGEQYFDDGHYAVRQRVRLISQQSGAEMAVGDGYCTSRESKYAYRWLFASDVPAELDKHTLRTRKVGAKQQYTQYRVPNEDIADMYNTVLKMAFKRGLTAASLCLPLVSELFTQDLDEQAHGNGHESHSEEHPAHAAAPPVDTEHARALKRFWTVATSFKIPRDRIQDYFLACDPPVASTRDLSTEQLHAYTIQMEQDQHEAFLPFEQDLPLSNDQAPIPTDTPASQDLLELAAQHIYTIADEDRREELKTAIAQQLYGVPGWPHLVNSDDALIAPHLPVVRHLCTRIESQGLPDRLQYEELAQWVLAERDSKQKMQVVPE